MMPSAYIDDSRRSPAKRHRRSEVVQLHLMSIMMSKNCLFNAQNEVRTTEKADAEWLPLQIGRDDVKPLQYSTVTAGEVNKASCKATASRHARN